MENGRDGKGKSLSFVYFYFTYRFLSRLLILDILDLRENKKVVHGMVKTAWNKWYEENVPQKT